MWRQTSGWVTCAKPSRRNTDPRVSHTFCRRFLKQNYPKNISDVPSKILEKKEHNYQTNLVPRVEENPGNEVVIRLEFVIFLKLGFLWWKLKIFIANFSHVSPNRFWRIFSMLLHSHLTIKRRSVAISLMLNHNLTGLPALFTDSPPFPPREWRQTRVSCKRNGIPVCYRNKQRNFTTKGPVII